MTHRRPVALGAVLVLVLLVVPVGVARASGGGGCGEPITSESGTQIDVDGFCFTPTVLHAEPGDTVTWTNRDPVPHNVAGANLAWGSFEQIRRRRSVSYSFSEAGVYSYVCTLHPGMVGTVVVGDPAPGGAISTDAVRRIKNPAPVSAVQDEPVPSPGSDEGTPWFVVSFVAVVIGGAFVGRRLARRARV